MRPFLEYYSELMVISPTLDMSPVICVYYKQELPHLIATSGGTSVWGWLGELRMRGRGSGRDYDDA